MGLGEISGLSSGETIERVASLRERRNPFAGCAQNAAGAACICPPTHKSFFDQTTDRPRTVLACPASAVGPLSFSVLPPRRRKTPTLGAPRQPAVRHRLPPLSRSALPTPPAGPQARHALLLRPLQARLQLPAPPPPRPRSHLSAPHTPLAPVRRLACHAAPPGGRAGATAAARRHRRPVQTPAPSPL